MKKALLVSLTLTQEIKVVADCILCGDVGTYVLDKRTYICKCGGPTMKYETLKSLKENYKEDVVNHPTHYNHNEHGIECIDAIQASMTKEEFNGYLKGNALKYQWRYGYKGKPDEDLRKAEWYLKRLIKEVGS